MKAAATPYWKKLLDPRWQKKRLEIFNRDEFTCRCCFEPGKTLHVHHFLYRKNTEPWDYPDHELWTVCEECHGLEEEYRAELLSLLSLAVPESPVCNLMEAVREILGRNPWTLWDWFHVSHYPDLIKEAARRHSMKCGSIVEDYSI